MSGKHSAKMHSAKDRLNLLHSLMQGSVRKKIFTNPSSNIACCFEAEAGIRLMIGKMFFAFTGLLLIDTYESRELVEKASGWMMQYCCRGDEVFEGSRVL